MREALKAAYQRSSITRGALKAGAPGGATTNTFLCSAPMIYLSTVEADESELRERSIEVKLAPNMQHKGDHRENLESIKSHPEEWDKLFIWSKLLVRRALSIEPDAAYAQYMGQVAKIPDQFDDRVRNSFAWVFFGLEFLYDALVDLDCSHKLLKQVSDIQEATWNWVVDNQEGIHMKKSRTELDNFFEQLIYINKDRDSNRNPGFQQGYHYIRLGNILYLDGDAIMLKYRKNCHMSGHVAEYSSSAQIHSAINEQDYFLGKESLPNISGILQSWLKFDVTLLEERGNDYSSFEEG
jgi:hypothetical protein